MAVDGSTRVGGATGAGSLAFVGSPLIAAGAISPTRRRCLWPVSAAAPSLACGYDVIG